jgi:hypothetical protein
MELVEGAVMIAKGTFDLLLRHVLRIASLADS